MRYNTLPPDYACLRICRLPAFSPRFDYFLSPPLSPIFADYADAAMLDDITARLLSPRRAAAACRSLLMLMLNARHSDMLYADRDMTRLTEDE